MSNSTQSTPTQTSDESSGRSKHDWRREGESFKTGSQDKRERMALYVEWLLTPPSHREHKTRTAFAESLGVHVNTLGNYDREAWVQRELTERARAEFKTVSLTEVLTSLRRIATGENADGETKHNRFGEKVFPNHGASVSAAKTLLDWVDKTDKIRTGDLDLTDLTQQDLLDLGMQLLTAGDGESAN